MAGKDMSSYQRLAICRAVLVCSIFAGDTVNRQDGHDEQHRNHPPLPALFFLSTTLRFGQFKYRASTLKVCAQSLRMEQPRTPSHLVY